MANIYDIGDKVKITGTFKQNGVAGDPAVVRAIYKDPVNAVTTLTYPDPGITKVSDGIYSFEILANASGYWYYRMDDGENNVASESFFQVRKSNVI